MKDLFPEKFLATIDRLTLSISRVPARTSSGQHLSSRAGPSLQFRDFKAYSEGDDLRRIDWNIYSRNRHLFVRRFDQPTSIPITVLLDGSGSMHLEKSSRYIFGAQLVASVIAAAISSQNPVQLMIADRLKSLTAIAAGRCGYMSVLSALASPRMPGEASISEAIATMLSMTAPRSRGVLVIVSDFFDDRGVNSIAASLQRFPGIVLCLCVKQPWDAEPDVTGETELIDCESQERLQLLANPLIIQRYKKSYRDYFQAFHSFLDRRGGRLINFDASQSISSQLHHLFPNGTLVL